MDHLHLRWGLQRRNSWANAQLPPCPVATHRKSGNVEAVGINSAVLFLQRIHNFLRQEQGICWSSGEGIGTLLRRYVDPALGIDDLRNDNETGPKLLHLWRTPYFHICLIQQHIPILDRCIVHLCTLTSPVK